MYKVMPVYFSGEKYKFNSFFGFLYSITGYEKEPNRNSLQDGCQYQKLVLNPFLLKKRDISATPKISAFAKIYAHILLFLWKYCYPLLWLLSYCRFSIYQDAGEANIAFRKIFKNANQNILCLPRSIFIATTSARFKKHGVMFIGCFFPSRHMHAWVIEDGKHADIYDYSWIMFTPVSMMK